MREVMWRGPIYIYVIAISRPYAKLEFTTHIFFFGIIQKLGLKNI